MKLARSRFVLKRRGFARQNGYCGGKFLTNANNSVSIIASENLYVLKFSDRFYVVTDNDIALTDIQVIGDGVDTFNDMEFTILFDRGDNLIDANASNISGLTF